MSLRAQNGQSPRWSDSEDAKLRAEWAAGKSLSEIGTALNRTRGMIAGKLRRLGLKLSRKERRERYSRGGLKGRIMQEAP